MASWCTVNLRIDTQSWPHEKAEPLQVGEKLSMEADDDIGFSGKKPAVTSSSINSTARSERVAVFFLEKST
jgi:hypothetical protein